MGMQIEYWRRVHKRSMQEACESLGLESRKKLVIKAIIAATIICVLAFYGSPDAWGDEWKGRLAAIAAVLLIFPLMYVWEFLGSPAILDKTLRDSAEGNNPLRSADLTKWRDRPQYRVYEAAYLWCGFEPPPKSRWRAYTTKDVDDIYDELQEAVEDGSLKADKITLRSTYLSPAALRTFARARGDDPGFLREALSHGLGEETASQSPQGTVTGTPP